MTARLRVENLSKSFGPTQVLDRVSFDVQPGRFLVLLGPSGSGKTTLLRCLAGIERADSGRIRLGDLVLAQERTHLAPDRRDLAMVFQDYALWPHMTAAANVGYALRRRRPDRETSRLRVERVLERVGLGEHAEQYPHQLSGGQQQRVALARALVAEPGLLLFDEPLSNLDADLRERLRVEIATLTRESGATVVYITHDQAEAFALADEVGVLEGGRLVQLGAPRTSTTARPPRSWPGSPAWPGSWPGWSPPRAPPRHRAACAPAPARSPRSPTAPRPPVRRCGC
ncbi:ABC transporter ATP-binding protein [Streptacidiphilus sp. 4-A2]|nr:ABC transporter ATP-binding protein [Streptacidiphilus sp. 4-A2]